MTNLQITFAVFMLTGIVFLPLGLDHLCQHEQLRTVDLQAAFFAVVACT